MEIVESIWYDDDPFSQKVYVVAWMLMMLVALLLIPVVILWGSGYIPRSVLTTLIVCLFPLLGTMLVATLVGNVRLLAI